MGPLQPPKSAEVCQRVHVPIMREMGLSAYLSVVLRVPLVACPGLQYQDVAKRRCEIARRYDQRCYRRIREDDE